MKTIATNGCSSFPMPAAIVPEQPVQAVKHVKETSNVMNKKSTVQKPVSALILIVVGLFALCAASPAQYGAWGKEYNDGSNLPGRCGSPRFIVKSGDSAHPDAFALKSTDVTVNIIGVLADVQIRQVYFNNGKQPIEATYIFPASTRAAVYAMTMQVKDRVINAVIKEKQQAQQIYQQAVASGRTASLLEQLKPNVFSMSVGNVLSHDSVVVNLHYSEAISYAEGEYEFVYPAVVGPRYAGNVSSADFQSVLSSLDLPKEIPGRFDIHCTLATAVPVKSVQSPSHQLELSTVDAQTKRPAALSDARSLTTVGLAKNQSSGNRDIVLRYKLSGPAIESGLLLSKDKDENFFMLMVQPPRQVEIPNILPREYVFIVDVSGSMWGEPLNVAKQLMSDLLDKLRPTDKFNILAFSGSSMTLAENSLELTEENKGKARAFFNNGYGGGGTEILPALKRALSMKAEPGYSRNFVIITDGFVQCEPQAFELVRSNLNKANVYAFGIGNSVNRFLMEGLARAGNAEPLIVTNMKEAPKMAQKFKEYIEAPVLTNISIDYGKLDVYDVEPRTIADVSAKRPIIVFGKWKGDPSSIIKLHGTSAQGAYDVAMDCSAEAIRPENSALRYLWARNQIRAIQDGSVNGWGYATTLQPDKQKAITDLGLKYNLLTDYTSFVAVDSVISVKKRQRAAFVDDSLNVKRPDLGRVSQDDVVVANPKALTSDKVNPQKWSASPSSPSSSREKVSSSMTSSNGYSVTKRKSEVAFKNAEVKVQAEVNEVATTESLKTGSGSAKPGATSQGVKGSGGGMSVRGSRTADTKMLIDGQDVSEPISGGLGSAATSTEDMKYAPAPASVVSPADSASAPQVLQQSNTSGSTVTTQQLRRPSIGGTQQNSQSSVPNRTSVESTQSAVISPSREIAVTSGLGDGTSDESPLMAVSASRSSRWELGPVLAIGAVNYRDDIGTLIDPPTELNTFPILNRSGMHFSLGWRAEYSLNRRGSSSMSFDLLYEHTKLSASAQQLVNVWDSKSFDSARTSATLNYSSVISTARLGLSYRFSLFDSGLGIEFGLSPGLVVDYHKLDVATIDSAYLWQNPLSSKSLPTDASGRKLYVQDQTSPYRRFVMGGSLAIQYALRFRKISVIPFVYANYEIVSAIQMTKTTKLGAGIRLSIPLRLF